MGMVWKPQTWVAVLAGAALFAGFIAGLPWALLLGVVFAIVSALLAAADRRRARGIADDYAAFAATHGWDMEHGFVAEGARFGHYPFGTGQNRRQESMIRGDFSGVRCASFTHVFDEVTNDGMSDAAPVAHQIALAELPVALPRIDLVPEGLTDQIAKRLGGVDVDVESDDFNRAWRVIADDARYAHAVLDPRMIERLLAHDAQGLMIRIEGGAVYTWQPGRHGPADLARRLGVVTGIARRLPQHLLREYRDLGREVSRGVSTSAPAWATEPGALSSGRPTALAEEAGWTTLGPDERHARATERVADSSGAPLAGPAWATESGALTSGRYTGIGVDADGDGIEDWQQIDHGKRSDG